MNTDEVYEIMQPTLDRHGIRKVAELSFNHLRLLYPRYAIMTRYLTQALENRNVDDSETFTLTTFTMNYLGMMELEVSRLSFELLMEQLVFHVREQIIEVIVDRYGKLSEEQKDCIRERCDRIVSDAIRPAMNLAIEEIFS